MRQCTVMDIECNDQHENEDIFSHEILGPLYKNLEAGKLIKTGSNASQTDGQESYVEVLAKQLALDPYHPYLTINKKFKTPVKYVKKELNWYLSESLSIKGYVDDVATWKECCTKDDKMEVNSNYGWCVFSEANGSQYDNCLKVLTADKTTRNGIIIYNRPSIYKDYKRDGCHDMICTFFSHFLIRDNTLQMVHVMRSNDARFGFMSDFPWSCFVYQNMYADLKKVYPELKTGKIYWTSDSMHLYSRHYDDLREYAKELV